RARQTPDHPGNEDAEAVQVGAVGDDDLLRRSLVDAAIGDAIGLRRQRRDTGQDDCARREQRRRGGQRLHWSCGCRCAAMVSTGSTNAAATRRLPSGVRCMRSNDRLVSVRSTRSPKLTWRRRGLPWNVRSSIAAICDCWSPWRCRKYGPAPYGCVATITWSPCCSANSTATATERQYSCHGA